MTDKKPGRLYEALKGLKIHDHACIIYHGRKQQLHAVIAFMRYGLTRHEQCVYVADENSIADIRQAMRAAGIDVEKEEAGSLLLLTDKRGSYVKHGFFDPDAMIGFLGDTTQAALDAGLSGLRGTGEMTWALAGDPGSERLLEYEAKLNFFLPDHKAVLVCQYNAEKFSSKTLMDIIRTHPIIIYEDTVCENPFYVPPDEFLHPGPAQGVERMLQTIVDQKNTSETLRQRERQQQEVAKIGGRALVGTPLPELMQDAVQIIADTLEVEFAKVLELLPGGQNLLLKAGIGWLPGLVGIATVGSDTDSQAGYTLLSHTPVIVEDLPSETRFSGPRLLTDHHVVSGISCIIQGRDGPYGVLGAHSKRRRRFGVDDINFLRGMANVLGQAISRAEIEESLRVHLRQLETLGFISSDISSSLDIDTVLKRTVEHAVELIGGDAGSIAIHDPKNKIMTYPYHYNMPPGFVFTSTELGKGLAGQVMQTGKSVIVRDYPTYPTALPEFVAGGLKILATAPVGYRGVNVGVIAVFGLSPDKTFSESDLKVLEQVGRQAGVAIEKAHVYRELKDLSRALEKKVKKRTAELEESRKTIIKDNVRLRELDKLKSIFVASTSHELRTPLSSVIGFSDLLLEETKERLTDDELEDLKTVNRAGRQLLTIVNDIIDISKVEAGKVRATSTDFNLRSVADEALAPFLSSADKKGLRFVVIVPELVLASDKDRLLQCLSNLISNAVKYTKQGSITLAARQTDGDIEVSVSDTGVGICEENLSKLFQPFERIFTPDTSAQPGVGLGLYLVKKLTEETLGGAVKVESVYGKGTTFTLTIPRDIGARLEAA